jgi:phosphate-selective porin OprO/OprP
MRSACKLGVVAASVIFMIGTTIPADASPQVRGRIHLDYGFHDNDVTQFGDGHRLRRARIGVTGRIDENWSYISEVDFAENDVDFKDVYLRYTGLEHGHITIGHFKVPFSMDELTSSNNISFIERALPNAFAQSRRTGFGYGISGSNYTFDAMAFGQPVGTNDDRVATGGDEGFGVGARATFIPMRNDNGLLHLGFALSTEQPANDENEIIRIRQRPESRVSGLRLVDTGNINEVSSINRAGIELGWQHGPFTLQSEYITVDVNRNSGFEDYSFDGYYAQASWMLTGERKGYRGGVFRNPSVQDRGAWELAVRYSNINLDDGLIAGGEMNNATIGLNYYANNNVRFMLNYIMVDSERAGVSDDPNIVLFRTQVSF